MFGTLLNPCRIWISRECDQTIAKSSVVRKEEITQR